ncbi:rhamnogalacturonan acetylesterase [Galbibacter pacificus]|uniref:Rhamnogalacturonan acetylesterase n=1 Tax=Galbibacter pacificus TaxID=2996052 RepID=A0ABT6FP66_9FLAO|nr:rhamnogalacturonan acetylesterase [Galbibacter pacificus]MDG3581583.1 rhamnogalacturonan acetylesterase [Galbibacter pacificus]MDG3585061.1 rhamnogalacturonan acetylesterase [Galbibacter pacificus]
MINGTSNHKKIKVISLFVMFLFAVQVNAQQISLYTIGDSTMANKPNPEENPERGWAQMLQQFFNNDVLVKNKAVNGRSTRSFINENRWDSIYNELKPGDYVFIQFGHNDQKIKDATRYTNPHTAYRHNLIKFVRETREKGASPILLSSIVRRNFNEHGVLVDTHGEYPLETRLVAGEMNVPFIDLQYMTEILEESYGPEKSKELHLHYKPGEIAYYPNGKEDNTHLSVKGATLIAKLAVDKLKKSNSPLAKYLK